MLLLLLLLHPSRLRVRCERRHSQTHTHTRAECLGMLHHHDDDDESVSFSKQINRPTNQFPSFFFNIALSFSTHTRKKRIICRN
jgi:hypothetical protein